MNWVKKHSGLLLLLVLLIVHFAVMNGYGLTWDFHFHFFGGGKLLGFEWQQLEPRPLPYVEPDPRKAWTLPYGPLMSIPPVASYLLFHQYWHWLPADSAYSIPIIFWGIAGIGILYAFFREAFDRRTALLAATFIALTPRYFGDMHNDMKDVPSAAVFALNVWLLWRLVRRKRLIDLLWAVLAFAAAFNVKINSVFIPIVFGVWLLLTHLSWDRIKKLFVTEKTVLWYFVAAPLAAFALWWMFWPHPIAQLRHAYLTFGIGTNNIEVILNGKWYCSGSSVPWYYPFWYLAITTPLPLLVGFITGMGVTAYAVFKQIRQKSASAFVRPPYLLLILWLIVPLTRYLSPNIGVIDGVRHFEEVLFPIAGIAAVGFSALISIIKNRLLRILMLLGTVGWLIGIIASYHPYQITYFNELVGGIHGAYGRYDLDYWGTSQKRAVEWVNAHAPKNANVYIVMASDVAGTYLRDDLIANLNKHGYDDSDFVVFLNRQSFYYRFFYAYEYLLQHKPAYTVSVHGTPLTWVFDNRTDNVIPRQTPWWQDEDPCIIKYWRGEHP
jgi:4-amino-4-deoxy-L-arabinose transferase-like glycosyltransferase